MTDDNSYNRLKLKNLAKELKSYDNNILLSMRKDYIKVFIYNRNNITIYIDIFLNRDNTFDLQIVWPTKINNFSKFSELIRVICGNSYNNKIPKEICNIFCKLKYQICLSFEDV